MQGKETVCEEGIEVHYCPLRKFDGLRHLYEDAKLSAMLDP